MRENNIIDIYTSTKIKRAKRINIKRKKPFRGNTNTEKYKDIKSSENPHRRKRCIIRSQKGYDDIYVPVTFKTYNWWDVKPYKASIYRRRY